MDLNGYDVVTGHLYTNIKCPICKHLSYSCEEYREEYIVQNNVKYVK